MDMPLLCACLHNHSRIATYIWPLHAGRALPTRSSQPTSLPPTIPQHYQHGAWREGQVGGRAVTFWLTDGTCSGWTRPPTDPFVSSSVDRAFSLRLLLENHGTVVRAVHVDYRLLRVCCFRFDVV